MTAQVAMSVAKARVLSRARPRKPRNSSQRRLNVGSHKPLPRRARALALATTLALQPPSILQAETAPTNWLLIEARSLPITCHQPLECLPDSTLILRNLVQTAPEEREALTLFLNRIAAIRSVPPMSQPLEPATLQFTQINQFLHDLPQAERIDLLKAHPGVFLDEEALLANSGTALHANQLREALLAGGVPLLTKSQWQALPGRPKLTLRFAPRSESAGCIIPFSMTLSLIEEAALLRNPKLKVSATVWSKTSRQNLANLNHTPEHALSDVISAFISDWQNAKVARD
ncbi:hypothetical protein LR948_00975 [Roseivivax sp. GX 12232]|uniref:hypothetical protein n=1 Tax=Roseivivax sp. GX 12232 TaxID=2900547 RepID=UPI001E3FF8B6|nr:hypothetical protein [Roseivivax sp. GX 12232]MCE0503917.1 hypothetical protein [Roseivivax sp. GX 12232]